MLKQLSIVDEDDIIRHDLGLWMDINELAGGMAMMRWVLIGFAAFFLTGCASRWEHSAKRSSEFYADDRSCQVETGGASKSLEPGRERMSYESCMWQLGWHKKQSIWFFDPVSQ